ncbi:MULTISPECIES: hypothetical protein [unclassified Rhizobium]|uniref:hypothetical protein n=1 Tax=unclassified Rhizobium TaxID=2613769 RepID=UPI001ADAF037|nr:MULTISPECIES: hypothetical protein [unclassified Rhizobium]MBO9099484.1 hypothetical protein [Rhizobium sp. L58/93]QXZ87034.1 hypothetical protein J5287_20810 [Rhizobium sp. K1/93]QXZ92932.1 hypothetical protein J5280_20085 [Rhizobium sp. K15/93]
MADDEMTPDEQRWFNRLRRVLRNMPAAVELQVHSGSIQMNREGAREEEFLRTKHVDSVESLDEFQTKRVYPCSESL